MKIILQKEVEKLGVPGDMVEVADGYARNYLIPRKLAAPATRGGVQHSDRLRRAHEDRVRKSVQEARALAEKPAAAVQACKRLIKQAFREQLVQTVKLENEEFAVRVRSDEAKEVFQAFFAKRRPASAA